MQSGCANLSTLTAKATVEYCHDRISYNIAMYIRGTERSSEVMENSNDAKQQTINEKVLFRIILEH